MKRGQTVAFIFVAAAVLLILVMTWWWAIFGMAENIATACAVTVMVLGLVGIAIGAGTA